MTSCYASPDRTWNIRPSGEYVLADKSYPVPMEVIVGGWEVEIYKEKRERSRRWTGSWRDAYAAGRATQGRDACA